MPVQIVFYYKAQAKFIYDLLQMRSLTEKYTFRVVVCDEARVSDRRRRTGPSGGPGKTPRPHFESASPYIRDVDDVLTMGR